MINVRQKVSTFFRACFKSKTFMLGHLTGVLGLLEVLQQQEGNGRAFLSTKQMGIACVIIAILIYVIRMVTTQPVSEK